MKIGEEVLIHGYIDEIRKDIAIIRNEGGYFGTVPEEIRSCSEIPTSCGDAISREAAVNAIYDLCGENVSLKENPWRDNPHMDAVVDALENLPSVTPQQGTGRWKRISIDKYSEHAQYWYRCDKCGKDNLGNTDFCPNCGCKMEVEE